MCASHSRGRHPSGIHSLCYPSSVVLPDYPSFSFFPPDLTPQIPPKKTSPLLQHGHNAQARPPCTLSPTMSGGRTPPSRCRASQPSTAASKLPMVDGFGPMRFGRPATPGIHIARHPAALGGTQHRRFQIKHIHAYITADREDQPKPLPRRGPNLARKSNCSDFCYGYLVVAAL